MEHCTFTAGVVEPTEIRYASSKSPDATVLFVDNATVTTLIPFVSVSEVVIFSVEGRILVPFLRSSTTRLLPTGIVLAHSVNSVIVLLDVT